MTEELGAVPPPSHSWMAPLVEDMLQEARTGLTKAMVIGPGRVVLFYGRHSMGEALKEIRLEMPHSSSQEQALGWGKLPTSLPTQ